jgi:hypothetical protein
MLFPTYQKRIREAIIVTTNDVCSIGKKAILSILISLYSVKFILKLGRENNGGFYNPLKVARPF